MPRRKPSFRCKYFQSSVYCNTTLFFVVAFKSRYWFYRPVVNYLLTQGYNVMVYDYPARPLLNAYPKEWVRFTEDMTNDIGRRINEERARHPAARFGIIGASVGSTLSLHAAKQFEALERMVFVTLYGSSAQLVWENKTLKKIKKKLMKANKTMQDAFDIFGPLEATDNLDKLGNRPVLMFASMDDRVIRYSNTNLFLKAASQLNLNLKFEVVGSTRHSLTVAKIMLDQGRWQPFFNKLRDPELVKRHGLDSLTKSRKLKKLGSRRG